jgi:hypothetical protein
MEKASFLDTLLKKGFKVRLTQTINIDPDGNYPPIVKSLPAQELAIKFFKSTDNDNWDLKSWRQYIDSEGNTKEWNLG